MVAAIDLERCNACGGCQIAYRDTAYQAIGRRGDVCTVVEDRCVGCGLCRVVCPQEAITLQAVPVGDESI